MTHFSASIAPLPLLGARVLDLSRVLAGPLCSMILGDLGADVIKVERPGTGDESRTWGPPFDNRGEAAYYLAANRNKLSVALDLDSAEDRGVLNSLVAGADVVVENFRPAALERRELAPQRFLAQHPRLLWCSISGFGEDNPRPGYDFVVQAEAGWMAITGEPGGAPMKVGVALADVIAGKDATASILAALYARERGALGTDAGARHIRVSLLHSAVAALVNVAQNTLVTGADAARWGNAHANLCPYQLFETSDGALVVAVGSDAQWLACARALGLDELADDVSLRTNAGRLANRDRVVRHLAARLGSAPAAKWSALLHTAGVPCGVVRSVRDAIADFDVSAVTGIAPQLPGLVRLPPPRLDEHGALIRQSAWRAFDAPLARADAES